MSLKMMEYIESKKCKYKLLEKITQANDSIIWIAQSLDGKNEYIIKQSHNIKQLKSEYNILISLDHPNFIKPVDFCEIENSAYIVQDNISAVNGDAFFKIHFNGSAYERFVYALKVLKEIINALLYMKSGNDNFKMLLHGDIKPANFLITNSHKVYLIDFNAASLVMNNSNRVVINPAGTKNFSSENLWVNGQYQAHEYNETYELHSLYLSFLDMANINTEDDLQFLGIDSKQMVELLKKWKKNQDTDIPFALENLNEKLQYFFKKYPLEILARENESNDYVKNIKKIEQPMQVGNVSSKSLKDDLVSLDQELQKQLKIINRKFNTLLIISSLFYYPAIIYIDKHILRTWVLILIALVQVILVIKYFWEKQLKFKLIFKEYYLLKLVLALKFNFIAFKKLRAISFILKKYNFNNLHILNLNKVLKFLRKKAINKKVNLAIVGEFSSGKSTLINALIETELLKTSPLPTTTCSNVITYSDRPFFEINKKRTFFDQYDSSKLISLIEQNTTEKLIAENDIKIGIGSSFLKGNINLIDTPGANSFDDEHRNRALNTIKNEADFLLILIKASQPLTMSLKSYINEIISKTDVRFAFVVTSIDVIPKREREVLLKDIQNRLQEFIGINNILIYPLSAGKKLDYDLEKKPEDKEWFDNFVSFAKEIEKMIHQSREMIIENRINRIIEESILGINKTLEDRLFKLNEKKMQFNEIVVRDIELLKREMIKDFNDSLKGKTDEVKIELEQYFFNALLNDIGIVKNEIVAINDSTTFNDYFANFKDAHFARLKLHLKESIRIIEKSLNYQKLALNAEEKFWNSYNQLKGFTGNESDEEISFNFDLNSELEKNYLNFISNLAIDFSASMGTGAVAGAALGTMIMPGVGSVIGGILGAVVGAMSGPSLAEKKLKMINESKKILELHYVDLYKKAKLQVDIERDRLKMFFIDRNQKLIDHYLAEVEAVNKEIRKEKIELEKVEELIRKDLITVNKLKEGS